MKAATKWVIAGVACTMLVVTMFRPGAGLARDRTRAAEYARLEMQAKMIARLAGDDIEPWSLVLSELVRCLDGTGLMLGNFFTESTLRNTLTGRVPLAGGEGTITANVLKIMSNLQENRFFSRVYLSSFNQAVYRNQPVLNFALAFKTEKIKTGRTNPMDLCGCTTAKSLDEKYRCLRNYIDNAGFTGTDSALIVQEIIAGVDRAAAESGMLYRDAFFSPMVDYEGYSEIPIEVGLEGTWDKLITFLTIVESRRIGSFNAATIALNPKGKSAAGVGIRDQLLNATINFRAFQLTTIEETFADVGQEEEPVEPEPDPRAPLF